LGVSLDANQLRLQMICSAIAKLPGWHGFYFVDNQRFISAAMRSRPASPSASLRRCPSGILRASSIISVARVSQSWLCVDWTTIRPAGKSIMNASFAGESMRGAIGDCLMIPLALSQSDL
jgi:hypothetical protein